MRTFSSCSAASLAVIAGLGLAMPAAAQKSADTLRFGYQDSISTVEVVLDPKPETILTNHAVFDGLVWYDPKSREYKPAIAESWKRLDDKTIEFKLRRDVKFHDGSPLTADDVVYSIKYLTDPASKLRFMNLEFVERIEKIDDYTVRMVEKRTTSYDFSRLDAASAPIYPMAVHSKLADKSEFGRKQPIGTGPYKVESVDPARGIVLVRNDNYALAAPYRPAATIRKVQLLPIPDMQTELAQMMTGGLDVIHDVPKDLAQQIAAVPNMAITPSDGPNFFYMAFDVVNRSGNAALSKPDVRKAIEMAIDRASLARNIVAGGEAADIINALCLKSQADCPQQLAVNPPAVNVGDAKKLLAAAGYPDGFDVRVNSIPGSQSLAEAIGGELRKIGIRAKVEHYNFAAYRDAERNGKLELSVAHFWSPGASPVGTLEKFFGVPARDYWQDETIVKLKDQANTELDQKKRLELYAQVFNRINERAYIFPLTSFPSVFAHARDVVVDTGALNPGGADLNRIHWK
jgi:peptide/nickel transport system substrate-binding protein